MSMRIVTSTLLACVAFGAPSTLSPAKIARIDTTADALLALNIALGLILLTWYVRE